MELSDFGELSRAAVSPSALRPVDEPLGHEPFDVLRVSSGVEKLEAEWIRSSRIGPKGDQKSANLTLLKPIG